MLELDKLVFAVDSSALDTALAKVTQLSTAVNNLNTPLDKAAKTSEKLADSHAKVATAAKSVSDSQEQVSKKTTASISALEKQQKILDYMTQGFSRGQASILAMADAAGTATSDLNELGKVLQTQRKLIGGDPFDKSTSGLVALTTRLGEAKEANRLYTAGIELTKSQTRELARDKERIIEKMKVEGASLSAIKDALRSHNAAYIAAADAVNRLDKAEKSKIITDNQSAKALEWLDKETRRIQNALAGMNDELKVSTSNQLFRYEEQLRKSGLSASDAKARLDSYRISVSQLNKEQQKQADDEMKRRMNNLSRGLAPQISDVAVSLYGGMPLTTVIMQQGLQVRDLIQSSGVAAADLNKVLAQTGKEFIGTLSGTASAVGSMMLGVLKAAADSAVNLAGSLVGVTNASGILAQVAPGLLLSLAAGLATAALQVGALAVAFFQVQSSISDMNTVLNTNGASLGMTKKEMYDLAVGTDVLGSNLTDVIDVFSQMVKAGKIPAESYKEVAAAALNLSQVSGQSTDEIVKDFAKLADEPIKVLSDYAIKSGEVSQAEIQRVQALLDAGLETQALTEATKILGEAMNNTASGMQKSMTPIGQLWFTIKQGISEAWERLQEFSQSPVVVEPFKNVLQTVAVIATEVWFGIKGIAQSIGGLGAIAVAAFNDIKSGNLEFTQTKAVLASIEETDKARASSYQDAIDRILQLGKYTIENTEIELKSIADKRKANSDAENQRLAYEKVMKDYRKDDREADIEKLSRSEYIAKQIEKANKGLIEGNKLKEKDLALIREIEGKKWDDKQKKPKKSEEEKALEQYIRLVGDLSDKAADLNPNFSESVTLINRFTKSEEQRQELLKKLVEQQPLYKAGLKAEADAHKENQKALDDVIAGLIKKANATQELIAWSQKLNLSVYEESEALKIEQQMLGLNSDERERQIALLKIQTKYNKELAEIQGKVAKKEIDPQEEARLREEALARKEKSEQNLNTKIAIDAAKKLLQEYERIKEGIADSIVTALFEGGQAGSKKLRDLIVSELRKPITIIVKAIVDTAIGNITGLGNGQSVGNNILSGLGLTNNTGMLGTLASSTSAYGMATGISAGGSQAAMLAAQTGEFGLAGLTATAEAAGGAMSGLAGAANSAMGALSSIPGWGWALAGAALLINGMDDSGTMHTGGSAMYSANGGLQTSTQHGAFGTGFGGVDFSQATTDMVSGVSKGIVTALDSVATNFGKQAGYSAATSFADDTSKDGAWGALMIRLGDKLLLNWDESRMSDWAPRVFADGEQGAKEYAAAVAKDFLGVLKQMDLPQWANDILDSIGDSPSMENVTAALDRIQQLPSQILTTIGTSTSELSEIIYLGMQNSDPEGAGKAFASTITNGIETALYQGFAQQITNIISTQLITPIITAALAGTKITELMSAASIETMKQQVARAGAVFAEIVNNPVFKQFLTDVGGIVSGTVSGIVSGLPQAPAPISNYADSFKKVKNEAKDTTKETDKVAESLKNLAKEGKSLEAEYLELIGKTIEAKAITRELATEGMTELEIAAWDSNEALREKIKLYQKEKQALTDFWSAVESALPSFLTGADLRFGQSTFIANNLNKAGVGTGNAMNDARSLMQLTPAKIRELAAAFVLAEGNSVEAKTAVIEAATALIELAEAAEGQALSALTKWSQTLTGNAEKATDRAFAVLQKSIESQIKLFEDEIKSREEQIKVIEKNIDTLQKSKDNLKEIFDLIKEQVNELYGTVDSTSKLQQTQAALLIREAITTGVLPSKDVLTKAISTIRTGLDKNIYTTKVEQDKARLTFANELNQLQSVTGSQLTEAEKLYKSSEDQVAALKLANENDTKTITALNESLEYWKQQVELARGTYIETINVKEAINALAVALGVEAKVKAEAAKKVIVGNGVSYNMTTGTGTAVNVDTGNTINFSGAEALAGAVQHLQQGGSAERVYDVLANSGYSMAQVDTILGLPAGTTAGEVQKMGLPGFAVGTNYVPHDMPAMIHEGEMIVPKKFNPAILNNQTDNSELVKEIELMRYELRANVVHTSKLAKQIERLTVPTSEGEALQTKAVV